MKGINNELKDKETIKEIKKKVQKECNDYEKGFYFFIEGEFLKNEGFYSEAAKSFLRSGKPYRAADCYLKIGAVEKALNLISKHRTKKRGQLETKIRIEEKERESIMNKNTPRFHRANISDAMIEIARDSFVGAIKRKYLGNTLYLDGSEELAELCIKHGYYREGFEQFAKSESLYKIYDICKDFRDKKDIDSAKILVEAVEILAKDKKRGCKKRYREEVDRNDARYARMEARERGETYDSYISWIRDIATNVLSQYKGENNHLIKENLESRLKEVNEVIGKLPKVSIFDYVLCDKAWDTYSMRT